MSVSRRMSDLLGEEGAAALVQDAAAILDNPNDLTQKAANVLIVGLQHDLPDDPDAAVDMLLSIFQQLKGSKKVLLHKAMRRMGSTARAMGMLRAVKQEY